jgi:ribosome biogenesis protein Nip4
MMYRKPTKEEKTLLNRAFDRWGAFDHFKDKPLLISGTQVCLVSQELEPIVLQSQSGPAGLVIGDLKKQFMPSMAGADLFARVRSKNDLYVTVNDNAEQLVLYGRDVMGDSITNASDVLRENELVILLGSFGAIGVGRTRFAGKMLFQTGKITITNVIDAGYYLREEG